MISESAKTAFTLMLNHNFTQSLDVGAVKGQWEITPKQDDKNILGKEFEMLTISSYSFRVMIFLHFTPDQACRTLISQMLQIPVHELPDERFYDYLSEISNIFCGAIKRDIGIPYKHCGMSTPNRLSSHCMMAFKQLKNAFNRHIHATHQSGAIINGSLYVINHSDMDFSMSSPEITHSQEEAGELELF